MYKLYYNLLFYFIWSYATFIFVSFFKVIVMWIIFDQEIRENRFYYGRDDSIYLRYFSLVYLPEPYVEGRNFKIFVNCFFFIFSFCSVLMISVMIISMETDLEIVYRDKDSSEISLFTLEFYNIPRDKFVEFEHLIVNYLCCLGEESKILSICHVFDLREYFEIIKSTKAHESYLKQIIIKEHLMPEEIDSTQKEKIDNNWNRKTLQEIKLMLKFNEVNNGDGDIKKGLDQLKRESVHLIDLDVEEAGRKFSFERFALEDRIRKKDRGITLKNVDSKLLKIKQKLQENKSKLYMKKTFVSFTSIRTCVNFLKMWLTDRQQENLASGDQKYDYISDIKTKIAPFIDEIRWENYFKKKRYYIFQQFVIIFVSSINFILEYNYDLISLNVRFGKKTGYTLPVLINLIGILLIQILLVIIAVIVLQSSLEKEKYAERSKMIEVQFTIDNILIIVNNIIVVFYGYLTAARHMAHDIKEDQMSHYLYYINFQWLKNASIVVFLPLGQRFVGDYLLKSKVLPYLRRKFFDFKSRVWLKKDKKMKRDLLIVDSHRRNVATIGPLDEQKIIHEKKHKLEHDFGLNSAYLIHMSFLTGFYLPLTSPAHHLLVFLGILTNYHLEISLLKSTYRKSKYISIGHIFNTIKFSFIAFCCGSLMSFQNSHVASYIFGDSEIQSWGDVLEIGHMVSFCALTISVIFLYLLQDHNVMLRLLSNLKQYEEMVNSFHNGSGTTEDRDFYFKEDFEYNNYKEQNPFYTLMEMTPSSAEYSDAEWVGGGVVQTNI